MKKLNLSVIFDLLFIFLSALLVLFTVLRFYGIDILLSFFISLTFSVIVSMLMYKLLIKRNVKSTLKKDDYEKKQEVFFNLPYLNGDSLNEYLLRLFTSSGADMEIKDGKLYLKNKDVYIFPIFKSGNVTADDIITILKQKAEKKILIVSSALDHLASEQLKKTDTAHINENQLFILMQKNDCFPPLLYKFKTKKKKAFYINLELSRKKAKNFLFFGAVLLFFSLFVAFPVYYLVMGTLMIISAVFLRFYGKKEEPPPSLFL